MSDLMTKEGLEWIINSILENACEAVREAGDIRWFHCSSYFYKDEQATVLNQLEGFW